MTTLSCPAPVEGSCPQKSLHLEVRLTPGSVYFLPVLCKKTVHRDVRESCTWSGACIGHTEQSALVLVGTQESDFHMRNKPCQQAMGIAVHLRINSSAWEFRGRKGKCWALRSPHSCITGQIWTAALLPFWNMMLPVVFHSKYKCPYLQAPYSLRTKELLVPFLFQEPIMLSKRPQRYFHFQLII